MIFLGIDWGKIFSLPFWLEVNPGELSDRFEKIFLLVLLASYAIYGVSHLRQWQLRKKLALIKVKFWKKVATFCLTMAVSFTFIFFFRYEAIPVLGGRFWIFIWVVMCVVWLIYLLNYYLKELPSQLKDFADKKKMNKYLGNNKK